MSKTEVPTALLQTLATTLTVAEEGLRCKWGAPYSEETLAHYLDKPEVANWLDEMRQSGQCRYPRHLDLICRT